MGAPGLADLQHLVSAVGISSSPYSIWIALRMPRSPPERTSGRSRWKIRNISAVHWPRPRTATISSITSSSPSSSSRSSSSSPLRSRGRRGRGRTRPCARRGRRRAGPPRSRFEQLLGRRGAAAEEVEHAQVDRPRRFGRELLADDRPQQRPVGVGRPLLAAPRAAASPGRSRRSARSAPPSPGRRRPAPCAPWRSPSLPLRACASRRRRGSPRGSPRRRSRTRAARSAPPPAASLSIGVGVEQVDRAACCRASRAARWRRSRRPARPTRASSSLVGDDFVDEADLARPAPRRGCGR